MFPSPSGRTARRAFSLVELVVVTLLLGIMAGVAAPRYVHALARYRASSAAARVAADLRLARSYARRTSVPQSVQFNVAGETYAIPTMPDVDRPGATYAIALSSTSYQAEIVSADFDGASNVQFDLYGRPDESGSIVVRSGNLQKTIVIDALGNIQVL